MVKITSQWVPNKYILSLLIFALGVGVISSQAYATAIYSQAPNQTSGWISDQAFLYETADNFTLGSAATVFSIEWTGGIGGNREEENQEVTLPRKNHGAQHFEREMKGGTPNEKDAYCSNGNGNPVVVYNPYSRNSLGQRWWSYL